VEKMFRLSFGTRRDPAVDAWFDERPQELSAVGRQWFETMRECGEDVLELLHDGCPVACIQDVPFAYVNVFKAHVNVGFYFGALLKDPAGLLEGAGKRMRHVKLKPDVAVDPAALRALIGTAYLDLRRRLRAV